MNNMICEKCGRENSTEAKFCTGCGSSFENEPPRSEEAEAAGTPPEVRAAEEAKAIKSHMTAAVLTTVFLGNWIFGIPAIVFAKECETAAMAGRLDIAERFSRRALTFLTVGSALSVALISFLVMILNIVGIY